MARPRAILVGMSLGSSTTARLAALLVACAAPLACGEGTSSTPTDAPSEDASAPTPGLPDAAPPPTGQDAGKTGCAPSAIDPDERVEATLRISVDDEFSLYVNGALVKTFTGLWTSPQTETLSLFRHPGRKNLIAVRASNALNAPGLDRMVVADLTYTIDGQEHHLVTNASFRRSTALIADWTSLSFVEGAEWVAASEVGTHGDPPYGAVLGASEAKYVWSYDPAAESVQATKPPNETLHLRRVFYVGATGAPRDAPDSCPPSG